MQANKKYNTLINKLTQAANANATRGKSKKSKRPVRVAGVSGGSQVVLRNHWNMLADPCMGTLAESAYRGRAGYVGRYTVAQTITTGVNTCVTVVASPASGAISINQALASATAFTPSFDVAGPGQVFLLANSVGTRCIGYCLDIDFVGTELERQGLMYGGVLNAQNIPMGTATSADAVKVLLTNETRTPDRQITQLWFPGVGDEEYVELGIQDLANVDADKNTIVFVAENMPAGLKLRLKWTAIYEWQPKPALGLVAPLAAGGTNPQAAYERLHEMAKDDPRFSSSFTAGFKHRAGQYATAAGSMAADAAVGAAYYYGMNRRRRAGQLGM